MKSLASLPRRGAMMVTVAAVIALGIASVAIPSAFSAHRGGGGEAILIKTHITFGPGGATGEVLRGSFIGDAAFCRGGRFRDQPTPDAVLKRFRCGNGRLTISFRPGGVPPTASSPWRVVSGSGRYEGLRGHGWMVSFGGGPEGREIFAGTVAG